MRKLLFLLLFITTALTAQESGLNEIYDFDKLALMRSDIISLQQSSHDPYGGNTDGFNGGNFPKTFNGENVMLHAVGKGIINRIWLTGYELNDKIKIYFDGETTASVNETVSSFFSGVKTPYLSPLLVNDEKSSGGFFSYMPFPFEESVMITTTGNRYYNINYQLYENNNTEISTWTGNENLSGAYQIFNNKGSDPRSETNYSAENETFTLSEGASHSAININASNQALGSLLLKIPDLEFTDIHGKIVTDNGRATVGYSQFTLKVNPAAEDIVLRRRFDTWVGNQKANVFVDDQIVGEWLTPPGDGVYRWMDADYTIPSAFTTGKDEITIKIAFISSTIDWNEFYYWIYCDEVLTDELDVGTPESESAHDYTIDPLNWSGSLSATYGPQNLTEEEIAVRIKNSNILDKVRLQIYYDGETTPSVDAPIGLFFGLGTLSAVNFQSLPVGVNEASDQMYCYFPMPFESSLELKFVNNSDYELSNVEVTAGYDDLTSSFSDLGYFKTQFRGKGPVTTGDDYIFLDETGYGKYVGMVMEVFDGVDNSWLEGDERFYIDGSRTPAFYGTGTEDYFNGAWYFSRGTFDLATHGYTAFSGFNRSLYRFHLSDPIYFLNKGIFGIEHGPINDVLANYQSLAFYYHQPEDLLILTDELILGDSQSEQDHNYSNSDSEAHVDKKYYFEGDKDNVPITESGYYIKGKSEFTVSVSRDYPVRIKRMFDYGLKDQTADIYVDGNFVGAWYSNGGNSTKRWREEFFIIPAEFTSGKSRISIKIEASTNAFEWSEFHYWIYTSNPNYTGTDDVSISTMTIYPNPSNTNIYVENGNLAVNTVSIFDNHGKLMKQMKFPLDKTIDISSFSTGLYFIQLQSDDKSFTKKFIKS